MDKQYEESRRQFECWRRKFIGVLVNIDRDHKTGNYVCIGTWTAWEAWQSSRTSIVVDTPPLCGDGENDTEYTEGYNDGITATEKTIRAIGLSIKGE